MSQYRHLLGGETGGQLFSCGAFEISRFVISGRPRRGLGHVPKPSNEHGHLANEYKGRNGTQEGVPKPDGFGPPSDAMVSLIDLLNEPYHYPAQVPCARSAILDVASLKD
jgi:hypothetical protein